MAIRNLRCQNGRYSVDAGETPDGKQPRFYLSRDRGESEVRAARIRQLWESVKKADRAWKETTLAAAHAIRQGAEQVEVAASDYWSKHPDSYVDFIQECNRKYRGIVFVPTSAGLPVVEAGQAKKTKVAEWLTAAAKQANAEAGRPTYPTTTITLYRAINAYAEWIRLQFLTPAEEGQTQTTSPHGNTLARQVELLKASISDCPLTEDGFGYAQIEAMATYFKGRPPRKGTRKPISPATVQGQIKTLRRFIKWVPKHFAWRKPEDWHDATEYRIKSLLNRDEIARTSHARPVKSYTVAELKTIWQYATQFERLLFVLALNCGFGAAELDSLRDDEFFHEGSDWYIKRVRTKTGVYGEHWLWPLTVDFVKYAHERTERDQNYAALPHRSGKQQAAHRPPPRTTIAAIKQRTCGMTSPNASEKIIPRSGGYRLTNSVRPLATWCGM